VKSLSLCLNSGWLLPTKALLNRTCHRQRSGHRCPKMWQDAAHSHWEWYSHTVAFAIRLHCWLICFEINAKLIYTTYRQFIQPFAPNSQSFTHTLIHSLTHSFGHSFIHANMQSSVENSCLFVSLFIEEEAAGLWMPNARGPDLRTLRGGNYEYGKYLSFSQLTN